MDHVPAGTSVAIHPLQTVDHAAVNGFLYTAGASDIVLCIMHPREFLATHYLIPEILRCGCAVWTQTSRSVGSDLRLEHETALLDVAAGTSFLRAAGYQRIVLVGNSGGASLYGFYNQQSLLEPARRLERTPGGRATRLRTTSMPEVDGIILVSPHPGQGVMLLNSIDPAVTDESDPLSVDPDLDFLDESNGYREGTQGSRYAPEFVAAYRRAQRARVERLDAAARALLDERLQARRRAKETAGRDQRVKAAFTPIMTIWRTDADLRCWDPTLDPSDRAVGSVWSTDPFATNYGVVGFARFCTPEAWLSTWSGLSSRASLFVTARSIEQPCLFIEYSGDALVFPSDAAAIFEAIAGCDKTRLKFRGNHHGLALAAGETAGRELAGKAIREWLQGTFSVGTIAG